ncbi:MAG: ABC transporter substrate-binding protein [Acidimicrobiales bacterium]|nr:ABC transporter substrate-binding protein [Acidimicrobiales bacterium]
MRRPVKVRGLIFGLVIAVIAAACSSSKNTASGTGSGASKSKGPTSTLTIGALFSETGPYSAFGLTELGGLKTAVAQINSSGGIPVGGVHYMVKLVTGDAASDAGKAQAAATGLVRDAGAKIVFIPGETPTALPVQAAIAPSGDLMLTDNPTISASLEQNPNSALNQHTFTVQPPNQDNLAEFLKLLKQLMGPSFPSTTEMMFPDTQTYSGWIDGWASASEAQGAKVLPAVRFPLTATDFTPYLTQVKAKHPGIIALGATAKSVEAMVLQMEQLGDVAGAVFSTAATASVGLTGNNGKPLTFPYYYELGDWSDPALNNPAVKAFFDSYAQANGGPPDPGNAAYAGLAYEMMLALSQAIQKAGTVTDVDTISNDLVGIQTKIPTGTFSFSAKHIGSQPGEVCSVINGVGPKCVFGTLEGQ